MLDTETEPGVVCPDCGREFRNEHALTVHRRRAHGRRPPGERKKKEAARKRRYYQRKRAGTPAAGPPPRPDPLRFCPCCGANLDVIRAAVAAAEAVRGGGAP